MTGLQCEITPYIGRCRRDDLHAVIDSMIELIPKERTEFIENIQWVRERTTYRMPELRWIDWEELAMHVVIHLDPETIFEDWMIKVFELSLPVPVEDLLVQ